MATSPSSQVYIFQDFTNATGFVFPAGWFSEGGPFVGGSCAIPMGLPSDPGLREAQYDFQGQEIRFFGNTLPNGFLQVVIDSDASYSNSFVPMPNISQYYQQVYQSPPLSDVDHTLGLNAPAAQCVDFLVVAPHPSTLVYNKTLVVDDTYTGIQYTDGWKVDSEGTYVLRHGSPDGGRTFMNTTHRTNQTGESLTFSFIGTNAKIYGNMLWSQLGFLNLTTTVDGHPGASQNFSTPPPVNAFLHPDDEPFIELADTGALPAGNHTITLTLNQIHNQTLIVDYILYTPTFDTLASVNLSAPSIPSPSPESQFPNFPSKTNVGAIAAGVIAGVASLCILVVLVFLFRRRRKLSKRAGEDTNRRSIDSFFPNPFQSSRSAPMWGRHRRLPSRDGTLSEKAALTTRSEPTLGHAPPQRRKMALFDRQDPQVPEPAAEVVQLRRQVQELTAQVEHLQSIAHPPGYVSPLPTR